MSVVPEHLRGLVDDATALSPAEVALDEALRAHAEHRRSTYADLVGSFVVPDALLPAVVLSVTGQPGGDGDRLPVRVVVSGGAGALEPAVAWATRSDVLELRALDIALRDSATGEVTHNARRIVTAVDQLVVAGALDDEVPVHVEPPRLPGSAPTSDWLTALDELAAADLRLKLRSEGVSSPEVATCIGAALDRELAFSCAGLQRAVGQHGFLNMLLATRASVDGASTDEVAAVLDETAAATLLARTDTAGLAGARRWFTSFSAHPVEEPIADLTALGLLPS